MISATIGIGNGTAHFLRRIRWLVWGAIFALLAMPLAVALVRPTDPQPLMLEQVAAHPGETCGCTYNPETI